MTITPRENMLLVYQHKVPEFLPLMKDIQYIRTVEPGFLHVVYEGKATGSNDAVDWFGQNWKFEPKIGAFNPDATQYIVKDITKWKEYVNIPDVEEIDWEAKFSTDAISLDRNKFIIVKDGQGPWERAFSMTPIADLLCDLIIEPEACYEFFGIIADHKIKLHNHYIKYYKPDALCMHDDYGSGQGLFMSPDTWRQLIKPHLQRIIDNVTSQGVMYEHHCCGVMAPLAEEIADMGASSWNVVHVSNNTYACKQKFGDKLALVGGICDGQFLDLAGMTAEEICAHVREVADKMLPGVGTVISVKTVAHPERTKIIEDELLKYGQSFFKVKRPS
ncbi:hypothetical protein Dhaf_1828 [Desulfitobacterium hafniense DCB-2]|uniref:Uroporphyrinogen decarboxylase (URO-D) domain-containing protein n=1 Tax=Desulfitobacterium hafniense (strain DSM 10664 / DCB-2) TaxID=272564 RepID=B8FQI1_DESHD|nr:uroporphyrinogen decarboxylase family protein [Desulfitobacterium hafniense]ACL19871.1 hypothetical protein Dhaf_1828 [Desulfitobacterium hafniense DCB-2]